MRKQFSITSDNTNFKRTLVERLSELQKVYADITEHVKSLKKANTYFSTFVTNVQGSNINLAILQHILSKFF